MQLYYSWYLLLPAALSVLYGYVQSRAAAAMGAPVRRPRIIWPATALSGILLTLSWSIAGFPTPVFYLLVYLVRGARLVGRSRGRRQDWFLLNLSYSNTIAIHLAVIGAAALARGGTMHTLLEIGRAHV